ncbi:MAG: division/cell wall cluster transcriptional repressor MraZ [Flavobacteriales bacterium]
MLSLLGEYPCKLDNKGRFLFPARLRKSLEDVLHQGLVVNRDIYTKCLVFYPQPTWNKISADLEKLNPHNRKHAEFIRFFLNGATEIELDGVGRINLPSHLLEYAEVDLKQSNELVLCGLGQKMELWNKDTRDKKFNAPDFDFAALAEEVQNDLKKES